MKRFPVIPVLTLVLASHHAAAELLPPACPDRWAVQNAAWEKHEFQEVAPPGMECGASGHCYPTKGKWKFSTNRYFDTDREWHFGTEMQADTLEEASARFHQILARMTSPQGPFSEMGQWYCEYGSFDLFAF